MGLFDLFKKKKKAKEIEPEMESKLLLAMPLFKNGESYKLNAVIEHLKSFWGLEVEATEGGDDQTAVFDIDGQMVGLANMGVPLPDEELESMYGYSYNWPEAKQDLVGYTSHAIVTVLTGEKSNLERYNILSKLLCSVLMTCPDCIGIYQGSETLLLPRNFYLNCVDDLKNGDIPVPVWVYIGMRKEEKGNSVYTYGMKGFGMKEMEIVNSKMDFNDIYAFMLDIASYVIANNIVLQDGETIGNSEEQKIKITVSKGIYLEGNTLKFDM